MSAFELPAGGTLQPLPTEPPPRGEGFWGRLTIAEWLLKHRDYLLAQIESGREVQVILLDLLVVAIVPTAFYGLIVGLATNSVARIVSNPIKLPLMMLLTMLLCLPTLYIFSSYLGGRRSLLQTAALAFSAVAITAVVLAGFAPITWFLTFTAPGAHNLHVLVNVVVFAISGFVGVSFLTSSARRFHADSPQLTSLLSFLACWIVLYGLVGAQMGWLLRPFFSTSSEWLRPHPKGDSGFFVAVWEIINHLGQ
jgi:hypothetical protein